MGTTVHARICVLSWSVVVDHVMLGELPVTWHVIITTAFSLTQFHFLSLPPFRADLKAFSPALVKGAHSELFFCSPSSRSNFSRPRWSCRGVQIAPVLPPVWFRGIKRPSCTLSQELAFFPEQFSPAVCCFVCETHFLLLSPCSLHASDGFSSSLNRIKMLLFTVFFSFLTA